MHLSALCFTATALFFVIQAKGSCDVDEGTPTVWLGDEEDINKCKADETSCGLFGLDFICEDQNGGEFEPCTDGTKVLCASPPPIPLAPPTPVSTFRVIAYNVWELRYLYYQNGQRERTCRIPREVVQRHPDVDVIVFNEAFMGGCFSEFNSTIGASILTFRDILTQYGFIYYTNTVGDPPQIPKLENGGVFIASRWPIIKEDNCIYTDSVMATADAISGKGAVYAKVEKTVDGTSMTYHILGTHLQATSRPTADIVRVSQAEEMHELMMKQNIPDDEPVIYAGDLNARNGTRHGNNVMQALDAAIPNFIGDRIYTYDGPENDLLVSNGTSWIDYAVFSKSHLQPSSSTLEVVRPRSQEPFDVCMLSLAVVPTYANSERCLLNMTVTDLADHYAVMGVFDFGSTTTLPPMIVTSQPVDLLTTDSGTDAMTTSIILSLILPLWFAFALSQ
nr:sphingomyelinase C-like [Lytechinus pictus]